MSLHIRKYCVSLALVLAVPLAPAQEIAPDVLMKRVTEEVISAIRQDNDLRTGHAGKLAVLVEAKILPHFDFKRITQFSLGPAWRLASREQQEQLTVEFTKLLVRTYSGALTSYRDQIIEFKPLRSRPEDTVVTVRSQVKQPGAEPIVIEYDLEKSGAAWKVFDVRVAGISLVSTYRSTFAEVVRNHGIEGLISVLSSKNRQSVKRISVKS